MALTQTVAYIQQNGMTISSYREEYDKLKTKLFEGAHPRGYKPDYPISVGVTLSLSIQQLISRKSEESKLALYLLTFMAFLAPDNIPVAFLQFLEKRIVLEEINQLLAKLNLDPEISVDEKVKLSPPELIQRIQEPQTRVALRDLQDYSLIFVESDSVRVHRLVQEVIRDACMRQKSELAMFLEKPSLSWIVRLSKALYEYCPIANKPLETGNDLCRQIIPHFEAVAEHCPGKVETGEENQGALAKVGMMYSAGTAYFHLGDAKRQRDLFEQQEAEKRLLGAERDLKEVHH